VLVEPALCQECGGKGFNLLQDESLFLDTQTVRIQEPLEELSGGEQPRQTNIILEDDLVDTVAPGNNVKITGVMKTSFDKKNKRFKNYIY
jgi:replicative DNA helicase Mcm